MNPLGQYVISTGFPITQSPSLKEAVNSIPFRACFLLNKANPLGMTCYRDEDIHEIRQLAELNNGLIFDCFHWFDPFHVATFLSSLPKALQRRSCLYIIRALASKTKIDDILETVLKPAIQRLIDTHVMFHEPEWLRELSKDRILTTLASIQNELGSREHMESEYSLIKQKLTECSYQLSAKALTEYLEINKEITEVYGLIDPSLVPFLDTASSINVSDNQRHLEIKLNDRQVNIHLFGRDYGNLYFRSLQKYVQETGLHVPPEQCITREYIYRTRKEYNLIWVIPRQIKFPEMDQRPKKTRFNVLLQQFKNQLDRCDGHVDLLPWLQYFAKNVDKLIHTYEEFVEFLLVGRSEGFNIPVIPDKTCYHYKLIKRERETRTNEEIAEYSSIYAEDDRLLNYKLQKAVEQFELWMKSYDPQTCEDRVHLVDFLYCEPGGKLIHSYDAFKRLAVQANAKGYIHSTVNPDSTVFINSFNLNSVRLHRWSNREFKLPLRKNQLVVLEADEGPTLMDILPVNNAALKVSKLDDALKKYLEVIKLAKEAVATFERKDMPFFDPLGGENACQIRAAMFAEILNKDGIDDHIQLTKQRLEEHLAKIKSLIDNLSEKSKDSIFLRAFLKQNNAILDISEDIAVIIASFILTDTKVVQNEPNRFGVPRRQEQIKPIMLCTRNKKIITRNFADTLVKTAQSKLSELTVLYVQRIALPLILSHEEKASSRLVYEGVKQDERHRKMMPFYPAMRLLMQEMIRNNITLVLRIEQFLKGQKESYGTFTLFFGNNGNGTYSLNKKIVQPLHKGTVVFHAKSITDMKQDRKTIEDNVVRHNVENLLLSASADHPQYVQDEIFRPDEPFYLKFRQLAHEWGTSRDNPSLFAVEHVYCSTIEQQLIHAMKDNA